MTEETDDELLREALLDLARAREQEAALRAESEVVLAGLRVLSTAHSTQQMYKRLLEVLRPLLDFTDAVIAQPSSQGLEIVASTRRGLMGQTLSADKLLKRATQRGPSCVFDLNRVPGLEVFRVLGTSLLLAPLHLSAGLGALILLHPDRGRFGDAHQRILKRLMPLLEQAVVAWADELASSAALTRFAAVLGAMFDDASLQAELFDIVVGGAAAPTA